MRFHILGIGPIGSLVAFHLRRTLPPSIPVTLVVKTKSRARSIRAADGIAIETGGTSLLQKGFEVEIFEPLEEIVQDLVFTNKGDMMLPSNSNKPRRLGELTPTQENMANLNRPIDSLIVCTKAQTTAGIFKRLKRRFTPQSTVVLLQNGMGVYEQLVTDVFRNPLERPHFVIATTTHAARAKTHGDIFHTIHLGHGELVFGVVPDPLNERDFERSKSDPNVPSHERALSLDDIAPRSQDPASKRYGTLRATIAALSGMVQLNPIWETFSDLQIRLRRKLVINAIVNPITALIGTSNGSLYGNESVRYIIKAMCDEACTIFAREYAGTSNWVPNLSPTPEGQEEDTQHGDPDNSSVYEDLIPRGLRSEELQREVSRVIQRTSLNYSSMLVDTWKGRETEVEHLNGYLRRMGRQYGIPTPTNDLLYNLIKFKEVAVPAMASRYDDDEWSDSDDEGQSSEIETSVLLGIPDGEIEETVDVMDPSVSRIGGRPLVDIRPSYPANRYHFYIRIASRVLTRWLFLSKSGVPLRVASWIVLYMSGAANVPAANGKKEDAELNLFLKASIRAWRGLKLNTKYAAKLAKKQATEREKAQRLAAEKAELETEKQKCSINPFSLSSGANSTMALGLGSQLFGERISTHEPAVEDTPINSRDELSDTEGEGDIEALTDGMEKMAMSAPKLPDEWQSTPSYRPIYLSTVSEYLPAQPKTKRKVELDDGLDDSKKPSAEDWGLEGWEKSIDIDGVFERFTKRIENEPEQCVRYDLKGTPLLFGSKDKVAEKLFPAPPPLPFNTKPGFAAPVSKRRAYEVDRVEKCDVCGKQRIFECQLMPNIINLFRAQKPKTEEPKSTQPKSEEEQRRELLNIGMEWGTCLIFSCVDDCCVAGEDECWREEIVHVQWDD